MDVYNVELSSQSRGCGGRRDEDMEGVPWSNAGDLSAVTTSPDIRVVGVPSITVVIVINNDRESF